MHTIVQAQLRFVLQQAAAQAQARQHNIQLPGWINHSKVTLHFGWVAHDEIRALQIAESISSGLSFICSIAVIVVCFSKRNPDSNRMPGFLAISDFGLSITTLAGRAFIQNPDGIPCAIQGWAVHVFFVSTMLWNAAMAVCVLVTLGARWDVDGLPKLYPWFHLIIWGVTFTNATIMAILQKYGDAILWCWLPASESVLRFAAFFDIIWAALIFNLTVYVYIGYELWRAQKMLTRALGCGIKAAPGVHLDDPVLRYARRVSWFILGYILIWVPPTTNRSEFPFFLSTWGRSACINPDVDSPEQFAGGRATVRAVHAAGGFHAAARGHDVPDLLLAHPVGPDAPRARRHARQWPDQRARRLQQQQCARPHAGRHSGAGRCRVGAAAGHAVGARPHQFGDPHAAQILHVVFRVTPPRANSSISVKECRSMSWQYVHGICPGLHGKHFGSNWYRK
ncbi:hypothetical protein SeMB42_g01536 [Synchytrium endobioticum]|uniref:G-protein coupled receptors family 2 profile 2 domain-containing protein n=1 Tax=Synchytrium endobioticum TaxID=286115 RepID=A0A507DKW0_9FUNG|nr:hypothetical protein SeMB42_g01536 [Synchytrium endobioticum]